MRYSSSPSPLSVRRPRQALLAASVGLILAACGNAEQAQELARTWQQIQSQNQGNFNGYTSPGMPAPNPSTTPPGGSAPARALQTWTLDTREQSSRFLAQASFGATMKDIEALTNSTANAWIENQFSKPQTSLLDTITRWAREDGKAAPDINDFQNAWWLSTQQDDQLRQRIAFSLSQIFVISSVSGPGSYPRGMAHFYDTLGEHAFGNFRQLLEAVTLHPMMGLYLTHIRNHKTTYNADGARVRAPDENFAREVMQLFTIGLEQLNSDGTPRLGLDGRPQPTYTNEDVIGLARVFTGWSWSAPVRSTNCFWGYHEHCNHISNAGRDIRPMMSYPEFHSLLDKRFLGKHIPAGQANPEQNLKVALDTLFQHPNVGPFIGKQLIQRLVTSNPSPAYVGRVAAAFNDNGQGVRGDMKAVIRAILLDPEARTADAARLPQAGRIKEPLLRITAWLRGFGVTSTSGRWQIGFTSYSHQLNQSALRSPSVFNFYRPGYTPPNSPIANAGHVAPEMQIIQENSTGHYAFYLAATTGAFWIGNIGMGPRIQTPNPDDPANPFNHRDVYAHYQHAKPLARTPEKLADHLNLILMHGQMGSTTRNAIISALESIPYPRNDASAEVERTDTIRVSVAAFLAMMSPDFLVLK